MSELKKIAKIPIVLLGGCAAIVMFVFWACVWAPVWGVIITFLNLIEFAYSPKGTESFNDYKIIPWFFYQFVLWNTDKADEYV